MAGPRNGRKMGVVLRTLLLCSFCFLIRGKFLSKCPFCFAFGPRGMCGGGKVDLTVGKSSFHGGFSEPCPGQGPLRGLISSVRS